MSGPEPALRVEPVKQAPAKQAASTSKAEAGPGRSSDGRGASAALAKGRLDLGLLQRAAARPEDGSRLGRLVSRVTRRGEGAEVGLGGGALTAETEKAINDARNGGPPLDDRTRTDMEGAFGADFSGVRVHAGAAATCLEGLTVQTEDGGDLMKVYGDNSMLQQGAAEVVAYSAETSQRSLRSIKQLARKPSTELDPTLTLQAIDRRIPKKVLWGTGEPKSLAEWHADGGPLWHLCNDGNGIFQQTSDMFKGNITGPGTLVDVISKDQDVHSGSAF